MMSTPDKFEKLRSIVRESTGWEWRRPLTDQELQVIADLVRDGALDAKINNYDPYEGHEVFGGQTMLSFASANGDPGLVRALLDAGADPNVTATSGDTSHAPVACAKNADVLRMLLEAGADVNGRNPLGPTALHLAASWGDEELVEDLLRRGADPLSSGEAGETPIQVLIDGREPQKPAILRMLQEAAAPHVAELRGSSVAVRRRKAMYVVAESFGAADVALQSLDAGRKWIIVAVAQPCEVVSQHAASILDAPRLEERAHTRFVRDARGFVPLVEFGGSGWTLAFADDLGLKRASALAKRLSEVLKTESILVFCELVRRYRDGFALEDHDWSEENIDEAFDPAENQQAWDAERERMQAEYNAWLAKHQILIPPYELNSTGYVCGITLDGLRKRDIAHGDIIVLQEHSYDNSE